MKTSLEDSIENLPPDGHLISVRMKNSRIALTSRGLARCFQTASLLLGCLFLVPIMNAAPVSTNAPAKLETATFGGGCFWCGEAVFQRIPGVKSVTSGFAGGTTPHPSYEEVCTGQTGHAEVIQIQFDPAVISFDKLLEVFFEEHDPTTLNRQGNDVGTQYRSIILYSTPAQKAAAEKARADAARHFSSPIVTQIVPLTAFYPAEQYHQNFYNLHPGQGYCQFTIRPKLQKLIDKGVIPADKK
ncbi:MAG: peptide-methionine (S)-S-oxide reductase MsrA [Verrucomicrobiota bacterium]